MNGRTRLPLSSSVRGRLALLVLAVLIPALLLATGLIFRAYESERDALNDKLLSTARALAGVVDGKVNEGRMVLRSLAASSAMKREDFATLDNTARQALRQDQRWVVVLDVEGNQLVNTLVPRGTPLPGIEREPEFAAAMLRGEEYVSNLRDGPVAQSLIVHTSAPVFIEGKFKYSLGVVTRPGALNDSLHAERYQLRGTIAVVDRKAIVIARSVNPEKFIGVSATPDMVRNVSTHREGVAESVSLDGIPSLTAFCPTATGWTVIIGLPKSQLYAPASRLLFIGLGYAGLIALVAAAMAFWIGRAVVRAVDTLSADAITLGQGRVPPTKGSGLAETDAVADAMRRTAKALLERTHTLGVLNRANEELVAERNLETIARNVLEAGREASGATSGACYFVAESATGEPEPRFIHASGSQPVFQFPPDAVPSVLFPAEGGLAAIRIAEIAALASNDPLARHQALAPNREVRSYLAVPIRSRDGAVVGALFFGHSQPGVFTSESEDAVAGLAAGAAIAFDNSKLYTGLGRELTAKSKVEAELRLAQLDLERKVEERTASLREAISQMEEFSYSVSHDLRSPLRAMNAYATVLLEDYGPKLDEQARNYATRILRSAERMDRLTRDVLSYSRIASGQLPLEAVDVEKLVRGTVEHYSELQPAVANVHLVAPLHSVRAHEPSLTQCVANLLINAVKFVKPGKRPDVTVRTEARGDRVRIWVEDRGIGISPRFQSRLFRIFERVATDSKYEDTGVGLAIVRKATEKMGGTWGVESDGVNGSRFWIELGAA